MHGYVLPHQDGGEASHGQAKEDADPAGTVTITSPWQTLDVFAADIDCAKRAGLDAARRGQPLHVLRRAWYERILLTLDEEVLGGNSRRKRTRALHVVEAHGIARSVRL